MSNDPQTIIEALSAEVSEGESLYAILDAARTSDIPFRLRSAPIEQESLYRGRKEETLWHVAPYVIRCDRDNDFFQWVMEEGWGKSWGIFLTSMASLEDLCKHFRQFLLVEDESGKELYFRFYDPRVLRVFLPTCAPEETRQFFGPVRYYLVEAEQPQSLLNFSADLNGLQQASLSIAQPDESQRKSQLPKG